MANFDPEQPTDLLAAFFRERHLATLTVLRPDGSPHVTPVGFTYEPAQRLARVITWADSWKAKHVAGQPGVRAAICSVDGGRWVTLYGVAALATSAQAIAEGVRRYTERYRPPKDRDDRVVIEVTIDRIVGRPG
jgi:PPOX class probable F420-dependent enzyme